jgi:ubiquinone/menaquinone biosynthesis C-methylase UbiE
MGEPPKSDDSTGQDADYAHFREMAEYERLETQMRPWAEATRHVLSAIGLGEGMSCLDVGSGSGTVMGLMAEFVGAGGSVTGLDPQGRFAAAALAKLRRPGGPAIEMVTGDLNQLDELPGAPFDVTFTRAFLVYLADPGAMLETMAAWTKPGGWVVAQEFDFGSIAVEPTCPPMAEFFRVFEGVFFRYGRNMRAGRQLPQQFEAAGLGIPDGTAAEVKFVPLGDMADTFIGVYRSLYDSAAKLGLTDATRASAFAADMAHAGSDGRYFCLTPTLIAAWKRVD